MMNRRAVLATLGASTISPMGTVSAHNAVGFVRPPLMPPATPVTLQDGRTSKLSELFKGKVTALQLMFTGCSATCPIQGALFAAAQEKLKQIKPNIASAQLVSLSIDPLGDGPKELRKWLSSFDADKTWLAVAPSMKALDPFLDFLQGRASNADRHTGQVYFFDPKGQLVLRTIDFPPVELIVQRLKELAAWSH